MQPTISLDSAVTCLYFLKCPVTYAVVTDNVHYYILSEHIPFHFSNSSSIKST